ncbi:MAG: CBS domain-containing protein [Halothiobacillaceae bacterium]|nr:CBS domain-containing protein [Halothiobacillaceae bacterium]MDY0050786.1 CBS domain-containing protein [Halothiobacillaceae bacterium]
MSFIVFGPGVRDALTLDRLFTEQVVGQAQGPNAPRPVRDTPETATVSNYVPSATRQAIDQYREQRDRPGGQRSPERIRTAQDIMSAPVLSLPADYLLHEGWQFFRRRRIAYAPLVDGRGQLCGIVSDKDLMRAALRLGYIPNLPPSAGEPRMTLAQIGHSRVLTASKTTSIREIARVMVEQHIGALPIIEDPLETARIAGIVTRGDLLRAVVNYAELELWL